MEVVEGTSGADLEVLKRITCASGNLLPSPLFRWLLAKHDRAVGAAVFFPMETPSGTTLHLDYVAVAREAQRGGVATALMKALHALARKENAISVSWEVRLDNEPAIALYNKLGASMRRDLVHMSRERPVFSGEEKALGKKAGAQATWTVRPATAADIDAVHRLLEEEGDGARCPGLVECQGTAAARCVLVAEEEEEGALAGVAILALRQSVWEGQRLFMQTLQTKRTRRRRGVATQLMEACMILSREFGAEAVEWKISKGNEEADRFFRWFGCERDDEWLDYEWPVLRPVVASPLAPSYRIEGFVTRVPILTRDQTHTFRQQLERWEATLPDGRIAGDLRFKSHLLLPLCAKLVRHEALLEVSPSLPPAPFYPSFCTQRWWKESWGRTSWSGVQTSISKKPVVIAFSPGTRTLPTVLAPLSLPLFCPS